MKKIFILLAISFGAFAQSNSLTEDDFYKIITVPIPQNIKLEVGGLAVIPDGRLAVCTRRGEVWMINNPYMKDNAAPKYSRFASGLHEPLGLAYINNKLIATQRGEVTILSDNDNDGQADDYKSLYKFPLSGNYHQYSYGPLLLPDGNMAFTLNVDWIGKGASQSKWRGWMLKMTPEGKMTPFATGLRSPAGFGVNTKGDIFYGENQGDWVGSGRVTHLEYGDMAGNPAGLVWSGEPNSATKLTMADVPDTGEPLYDVAKRVKGIKPPAVWFPHTLMGISTADIIEDTSEGKFGPFSGQYYVGDQGHSKVMRMQLEKVNGVYQGACFPFREGFQSGILRMRWGIDASMFVGMTSRGWASTGKDMYGLQRMEWSGKVPFEIHSILSKTDGFELKFTQKVNAETALNPESYTFKSFTYKYHHTYGSPVINSKEMPIKAIQLSEDGMSVRISLDSIRLGYIHEVKAAGIKADNGNSLLHDTGYYTLNEINTTGNEPLDREKFGIKKKEEPVQVMDHNAHKMPMNAEIVVAAPSLKRINSMPAEWNGKVDQSIEISTKPGLKYSVTKLQVKAGAKIKFTFNNNDDMLHNVIFVKPGTVQSVGEAAFNLGTEGETKSYVPDMPEVLFHTGLLQPVSSESIYFTVPTIPGDYSFVCTYPGHYTLMQGTLKVVK